MIIDKGYIDRWGRWKCFRLFPLPRGQLSVMMTSVFHSHKAQRLYFRDSLTHWNNSRHCDGFELRKFSLSVIINYRNEIKEKKWLWNFVKSLLCESCVMKQIVNCVSSFLASTWHQSRFGLPGRAVGLFINKAMETEWCMGKWREKKDDESLFFPFIKNGSSGQSHQPDSAYQKTVVRMNGEKHVMDLNF